MNNRVCVEVICVGNEQCVTWQPPVANCTIELNVYFVSRYGVFVTDFHEVERSKENHEDRATGTGYKKLRGQVLLNIKTRKGSFPYKLGTPCSLFLKDSRARLHRLCKSFSAL